MLRCWIPAFSEIWTLPYRVCVEKTHELNIKEKQAAHLHKFLIFVNKLNQL